MGETLLLICMLLAPVATGLLALLLFRRLRLRARRGIGALLLGNVLIFVGALSVVIAGGELYFRYVYDTTDSFGLSKTTARWLERHVRKNNVGIRDSVDYSLRREPGVPRLTLVGDSFTEGHGVADVERRFANLLRLALPEYEVHVLARSGFDTGREMEELGELLLRGYELDTVILVYCLNDISDIVPEWQSILKRVFGSHDPGFLVENSYLFDWLYYRWFASRDPAVASYFGFVLESYEGPVWERQRSRLADLHRMVDAAGGRLLVVTFPFVHDLEEGYEFAPVHERLDVFWRSRDVPHLDLLDVYEDEPSSELVVNPFDSHPNERAHAMAAEAIAGFIRSAESWREEIVAPVEMEGSDVR